MKILQVVSFFKPSWEAGGTVRVAYEISKELVKRGHDVTVYTTDGFKYRLNVEKNKPINIDDIKVYYFRNISTFLASKNICLPYSLPFVARKEIQNYDIIHLHTFRSVLSIMIWHYSKKFNIPYIVQPHGSLPYIGKTKIKNLFDQFFGYKILKDASKVIALTETEKEQYKKMGVDENKIEIVPNGIDLTEYEKLPAKGKFREKYGIRDDEKIILYVGRLHKSKGIDLLVKAFSDVSKELDNVRLVLVGPDDGYKVELEKLTEAVKISDKVIFTGFVSQEEKLAAMVDADVFVTPSFSGFPVTFLEGCACGVPIITTNRGDKLDWIHNKVGYVVEYDKYQLKNAIYNILYDDKLWRRFREGGKRLVKEQFNWENVTKRIEEIYKICTNVKN